MVLAMTFYGGLFEMVIGAVRENRPVVFGDLFSGFKKFGSYAMFALAMAGIVIGLSLLNIIPILGTLAMIVGLIWIEVLWLYVLPLIADQGLTFGEAQTRSRAMVKDVGWWKTFGMLILLLVAIWAVGIIIAIIASVLSKVSSSLGGVIGGLLFIVFEVVVGPYVICYISTMYLGSGGVEPAFAGGHAVPPAPPAPPQAPVLPAARRGAHHSPGRPGNGRRAARARGTLRARGRCSGRRSRRRGGRRTDSRDRGARRSGDGRSRRPRRGDGRGRRSGRDGRRRGDRRGPDGGPRTTGRAARGSVGADQPAAASAAHLRRKQRVIRTRRRRSADSPARGR